MREVLTVDVQVLMAIMSGAFGLAGFYFGMFCPYHSSTTNNSTTSPHTRKSQILSIG